MDNQDICSVASSNGLVFLAYAHTVAEARSYRSHGFEPVECAFGSSCSVVGSYDLDHHGKKSSNPPVSVMAAKIASKKDFVPCNKIVFSGSPDSDAIYASLVISGSVKPSDALASAIGRCDIQPFGVERTVEPFLRLPFYESLVGVPHNSLDGFEHAFRKGLVAFRHGALGKNDASLALEYEQSQIAKAQGEVREVQGNIALVSTDSILRDVHYARADVVVQYKPKGKVTVRGLLPDAASVLGRRDVFSLFGSQGLEERVVPVMNKVFGGQCGGRKDIVGSPHTKTVSYDQAKELFSVLVSQVSGVV